MRSDKIRKILQDNREIFETLEEYDKTHEMPIGRVRIDITLDKKIVKRLREIKSKSGKPISHIIEEALSKQE